MDKNNDENIDLRIKKTYDALTAAFQELLEEKSFEEITVKELCSRAQTRTATFYTHFDDKYDFFFFMIKELRKSFARNVENIYDKTNAADYYINLLRCGMNYLEENDKMATSIRSSSMLVGMLHLVQDNMTDELRKHLKQDAKSFEMLQNPNIMIQFLIGGMNQVTEWWFTQKKNIDKETTLSDANVIISNMLGNESGIEKNNSL